MSDGQALLDLAQRFLPGGLAVAWADPRAPGPDDPDTPPGAVPRRRLEFAAGRRAARQAFARLDQPLPRLPVGPDRVPLWPPGWTGSITHSDRACLAAVGPLNRAAAIGLDLEEAVALDAELWESILCPAERAWLETQPAALRGPLATRMFSAKEAAFKAQFGLTGVLFGFDIMQIDLRPGGFAATLLQAVPPLRAGHRFDGHQAEAEGQILSVVVIPA